MIDRYSCFVCADEAKKIDRKITEQCATCGRQYGFPLTKCPELIGEYKVTKALDRGYYSATFKAEDPKFRDKIVALKVIAKKIYQNHGKNFEEECQRHNQVAYGSQHIVQIENYFEDSIKFGDTNLDCYVAVLEFVSGTPIEKVIDGYESISATECTQVAIDLFTILWELKERGLRHNDLHGGNVIIERLNRGQYRLGAVDPTIRVKAIDINSAGDGEEPYLDDRPRDIQRAASLVKRLVRPLLTSTPADDDLGNRALNKLFDVASFVDTAYHDAKAIALQDIINTIQLEFDESQSSVAPWRTDIKLRRINEYYNAQSLDPWYASHLFVDPHDEWIPAVTAKGPQLITGMRGCGKTILLKALQFHARANHPDDTSNPQRLDRLQTDGYVGLYVSSSRLADIGETRDHGDVVSILFLGYIKSALEAIRHLTDLDDDQSLPQYHDKFSTLIKEAIPTSGRLLENVVNATFLNIEIEKMQYSLYRGEEEFRVALEPSVAFRSLAKTVRRCARMWSDHHILFLLDDVSTRYVNVERIAHLISQLLVQNDLYSFKVTSEVHTIRYLLNSPGNIEKGRPGRDYDAFDLGQNVRERIHGARSRGRKKFVQDILLKRFSHLAGAKFDQNLLPKTLLGDVSLQTLAMTIGLSTRSSRDRKKLYSGFSVLIGMCVGDIGDILNIYERFLQLRDGNKPLKDVVQSQVYFEFCSLRLYDLKRLEAEMEVYAMGFAKAANRRLVESVQNLPESGRVRQYNSIYIRITSEDRTAQQEMLKKINRMIDSGIFVSSGLALRSKTKDPNPLLQFILVFRKIYGLTHFIGLSERDRFELSGEDLEQWLENPNLCEEILLASPTSEETDGVDPDEESDTFDNLTPEPVAPVEQPPLLFEVQGSDSDPESPISKSYVDQVLPTTRIFSSLPKSAQQDVDTLVLGFGFEKRAETSLKRYVDKITPRHVVGFRYAAEHNSTKVHEMILEEFPTASEHTLDYEELGKDFVAAKGPTILDISGLSKALIFNTAKRIGEVNEKFHVVHTESSSYYPTDTEMQNVLDSYDEDNPSYDFLDSLSKLLGGEIEPYENFNLGSGEADEARNRVLLAFAKPKNERLYHLLDSREFDRIELITPKRDSSPRSHVARIVAGIVSRKYPNTAITELDANDIAGVLDFLAQRFHYYYVRMNANVEVALTGSKRQTLAVALLANTCKFSKVWYIRPKDIDEKRFSTGVGKSNYIKIAR